MAAARALIRRFGFDVIRHPAGTQIGASIARLLAETDCDLVVDVGANVGDFGRWIRRLGYAGRIVSFEPDPRAAGQLERAAARDPDWLVRREALGDADERRDLQVMAESKLSSFLRPTGAGALATDLRAAGVAAVDVRRLDGVLDELGGGASRIFLKLDTQGWELHVLRGADTALDRVVGLLVELVLQPSYAGAPDYLDILGWLRARDFHPADFERVLEDADGLLAELDCLLRRASRGRADR